jgi:hypothetical protein
MTKLQVETGKTLGQVYPVFQRHQRLARARPRQIREKLDLERHHHRR